MFRPHLVSALAVTACIAAPASAEDVMVFAAASLKTALDEIAADFEAATGHQVTISYAGSSALARQILGGAPADIFVSASGAWMDTVEQGGAAVPGTRTDLVGNRLVLVGGDPAAAPLALAPGVDLAGRLAGGKLAMALVDSVPAGQYGKDALQRLGLWDSVAPSVAQVENVRAALALVSRGEAPLGIVYATDAASEPRVHVVAVFPAETHAPIVYPAALLNGAADAADKTFFEALSAPGARAVFEDHGFSTLN